jgi:hypothetical protein
VIAPRRRVDLEGEDLSDRLIQGEAGPPETQTRLIVPEAQSPEPAIQERALAVGIDEPRINGQLPVSGSRSRGREHEQDQCAGPHRATEGPSAVQYASHECGRPSSGMGRRAFVKRTVSVPF